MPVLNVKVSVEKSAAMTERISRMLLDRTVNILRKRADLIAIAIDYVDPEHWIVGGRSSYAYVQDVRPTAYGFGGRTQEYRFQHEG